MTESAVAVKEAKAAPTVNAKTTNPQKNAQATAAKQGKQGAGKAKSDAAKKKAAEARNKGPNKSEMFKVHGTVMKRTMRIGHQRLARAFFQNWEGITHGLHYITDYARLNIKGRVVQAANRGLSEYLVERKEEARRMVEGALELADQNGVAVGDPGSMREEAVRISCPSDNDVMELVKLLDEYVRVMDSLWMVRVIDNKKRDEAHKDIVETVMTLNRLLRKMTQKMVDFKHKKMGNQLTRPEDAYASDIESLVFDMTGVDIRTKQKDVTPKKPNSKETVNLTVVHAGASDGAEAHVAENDESATEVTEPVSVAA